MRRRWLGVPRYIVVWIWIGDIVCGVEMQGDRLDGSVLLLDWY